MGKVFFLTIATLILAALGQGMIAFKRIVKTAIAGLKDGCSRQKDFCLKTSPLNANVGQFFFIEKLPNLGRGHRASASFTSRV